MADTVGNMTIRVLRRTLQNPSKTSFADSDDTQLILDLLNEASQMLRNLAPTTVDAEATFTIPINTRLIAIPVSGLDAYDIYDWSWQYTDANGKQVPLEIATNQFVYQTFPNYTTDTAQYPRYVYIDDNQIAVYPLIQPGGISLTGKFKYPALAARKTSWADTFPYPDNWLTWMERYAQYNYEVTKGLGNPPITAVIMETLYGHIFGKTKKARRIRFIGSRLPAQKGWRYQRPNVWQ